MRVVLLLALAASTFLRSSGDTREAYPQPGPHLVKVHVVNDNAHDINLYVIRDNERLRVMYLWSGESGDVDLGPPIVDRNDFMLEVDAVGLNAIYRTSPITPLRQTYIQLHIRPDFFASTFSVTYGEEETT